MNAIIALRDSLLQIKGISEKNVDGIVMGIAQNPTNIFDALASMNPGLLDKFRSNPSPLVREFTPFPVIMERRDRIVKLLSESLYRETGLRAEEIGEKLGFYDKDSFRKDYINPLIDEGLIMWYGHGRGTVYKISSKRKVAKNES